MHAPTASDLLGAWERGMSQPITHRPLTLLTLGDPQSSFEQLAQLPIGARDGRLLELRATAFGGSILAHATCPACQVQVELNFDIADVLVPRGEAPPQTLQLEWEDYLVRFRLPNSLDLMDLVGVGDSAMLKAGLFRRCVVEAWHQGEAISCELLPGCVVEAVSARMGEVDPQGDVQLDLRCPGCAHQWQTPLDIAAFFWAELQAWAVRLLSEVHSLAKAYGWDETDILAMNPWRRQAYLDLVHE